MGGCACTMGSRQSKVEKLDEQYKAVHSTSEKEAVFGDIDVSSYSSAEKTQLFRWLAKISGTLDLYKKTLAHRTDYEHAIRVCHEEGQESASCKIVSVAETKSRNEQSEVKMINKQIAGLLKRLEASCAITYSSPYNQDPELSPSPELYHEIKCEYGNVSNFISRDFVYIETSYDVNLPNDIPFPLMSETLAEDKPEKKPEPEKNDAPPETSFTIDLQNFSH